MNLGVLAHVDAGKTSITERLLYVSGAIRHLGSVDSGTSRTDSMSLEHQRGITIRASVTSMMLGGRDINIIDTPGHSDFIAEVERSLGVLDCAVLVVSAVEGVQPQTVILWRALRRVGVPTAFFVNKVDRGGASPDSVVDQIRNRLSPHVAVVSRCAEPGTRDTVADNRSLAEPDIVEAVAQQDARLLEAWAAGTHLGERRIIDGMRRQVLAGDIFPVAFGSAVSGTGVDTLEWILTRIFATSHVKSDMPSGTAFSVDYNGGGRRAWVRMWAGTLRVRDRISIGGRKPAPLTHLVVPTPHGEQERKEVGAGDIVAIQGPHVRIGDSFGSPPERRIPRLSPPTLQTIVTPVDPADRSALFAGLCELADEDPLIGLDLDERNSNATVRIHGEVQKEVIAALLEERYGVAADFTDTSVVCIESVVGRGHAIEHVGHGGNPYLATIGLAIESAPEIDTVEFCPGVERGKLPSSFIAACEEGVRSALSQGLQGWAVTGCRVTMTASRYAPRQGHAHQKFNKSMSSVGADFRNLAPVVTMACLERARTQVREPIERFDLELPSWALNVGMSTLGRTRRLSPGSSRLAATTASMGTFRRGVFRECCRPFQTSPKAKAF